MDVSVNHERCLVGHVYTEHIPATGAGTQINVVLNWFEELNRLVPTDP